MNKEIKIGDYTFNFIMPEIMDKSVSDILKEWCKLVEKSKKDEDEWTTIPALPQYRFKNLKIVPCETDVDISQLSITFKYDSWEKTTS